MDERVTEVANQVGKRAVIQTIVNGVPSLKQKCQGCRLACNWREYLLSVEEDPICPVSNEIDREKFAASSPITPQNIEYLSAFALDKLSRIISIKDPRELALYHFRLMEHKKEFYPEVQRSVSLELKGDTDLASRIVKKIFLKSELPKEVAETEDEETDYN